ncbi:MAG: PQQ-binding-like beta-propeller repeat protein [Ilumatobacteraceae bacterium]
MTANENQQPACPRCGTPGDVNFRFCTSCGTPRAEAIAPMTGVPAAAFSPLAPPPPPPPISPQFGATVPTEPTEPTEPKPSSSHRGKLIVAAAVVAVVALGVGAVVLLGGGDDGKSTSSSGGTIPTLQGEVVTTIDLSGINLDSFSSFDGGVVVNEYDSDTGDGAATAYDTSGQELESFSTTMSVAPGGALLTGLNSSDGEFLAWRPGSDPVTIDVGSRYDTYSVSDEGLLAVIDNEDITVSDISSGKEIWTGRFRDVPSFGVTWSGKLLAGIADDGSLQIVKVGTDETIDVSGVDDLSNFVDAYSVDDSVVSRSTLYASSDRGDLIAIDPAKGTQLWSRGLGDNGSSYSVAIVDDHLWTGDALLNPTDGKRIWATPSRYSYCSPRTSVMVCSDENDNAEIIPIDKLDADAVSIKGSIVEVVGDTVYVRKGKNLDAIDIASGDRQWKTSARNSDEWGYDIAVTDSQILMRSSNDDLVAIKRSNGEEIVDWNADLNNVYDARSGDGLLYVITQRYNDSSGDTEGALVIVK